MASTSPFPGMDPYLERHWPAVHAQLVTTAMLALNAALPDDLVARVEERLSIGGEDGEVDRRVIPDVRVFEPGEGVLDGGVAVITAPFKLVVDLDPATETFVRILRPSDEQLVAVVEFVSPANKTPMGIDQMTAKRSSLVRAGVHVVEIDLTRRGDWRGLLRPHLCPPRAVAAYRYTVRLGGDPTTVYLYPIDVRAPLPVVEVPLRPSDRPVRLDLSRLVSEAYQGGRYGRTLDYRRDADPPLAADDAAWADGLLRSAGLR